MSKKRRKDFQAQISLFKTCTSCRQYKAITEFSFRAKREIYEAICKTCNTSNGKIWYSGNKDHVKEYQVEFKQRPDFKEMNKGWQHTYYEVHKEERKEIQTFFHKRWEANKLEEDPEYYSRKSHNWNKNNPGKRRDINSRRRAIKLKACPPWARTGAVREQILQIYENCPEGYTIDHYYPLQGKTSSGLHVPWNLQYLTFSDNSSKRNKSPEEFYREENISQGFN